MHAPSKFMKNPGDTEMVSAPKQTRAVQITSRTRWSTWRSIQFLAHHRERSPLALQLAAIAGPWPNDRTTISVRLWLRYWDAEMLIR